MNKPEKQTETDLKMAQAMQMVATGKHGEAAQICATILEAQPNNAAALHTLGLTHYLSRRYPQAIELMSKAVEFDDSNPQYFCNLGEALRRGQNPDRAIENFEKALALKPEYLLAHLGMANVLRDLGRRPEAIARYRLALALDPCFAEAFHYLGAMYLEQDRKTEAIAYLRKAVTLKPAYVEANLTLANALDSDGQIEEAKEVYRGVLERDPNITAAHNNLANLLKSEGNMDEAIAHYEKALEISPGNVQAHYNLTRARKAKSDDKEIDRLEKMLEVPDLRAADKVNIHFALGKIYDDLGRYDDAFPQFQKGNDLDDRAPAFDPRVHDFLVNRLATIFSRQMFARRQGFGSDSDRPIFIVGMPRSGTTLTEQILSSHPQVFGAGELEQISHLVNAMTAEISGGPPYPESASDLDAMTACRLGESYVTYIRRLGDDAKRVTDKMPANFMHLGFIALLLPHARIVHCRRQPMDTLLSCYFQHFTVPMPYTNTLQGLGSYYRAYEAIMRHWHNVLPLDILDVQYEEMVSDHESVCRRLVEFAGLEWDDACLQFHASERTVKTASSWQVRQPLYNSSVSRWRHYEKFLEPLKEALGDAFYEFGSDGAEPVPQPAIAEAPGIR